MKKGIVKGLETSSSLQGIPADIFRETSNSTTGRFFGAMHGEKLGRIVGEFHREILRELPGRALELIFPRIRGRTHEVLRFSCINL